jgi:hypothetical protein
MRPGMGVRLSDAVDHKTLTRADHQVTWTTDDLAGAALWMLPDRWPVTGAQLVRLVRLAGLGVRWRAPLVMWGLTSVERQHPGDRHQYLAVLGKDPLRQGAGLGSQLLAPGLELCDRECLPRVSGDQGAQRQLLLPARIQGHGSDSSAGRPAGLADAPRAALTELRVLACGWLNLPA